MKKTLCFGLSAMIAVLISSCGEYHVDYECEVGDSRCEDDVIYKCVQAKDGSTTYWEKSKCDGVCKNNKCEECDINKPNWCEVNGDGKSMAYTCNKICKNNEESCSEDDKVVRKEIFACVNACDLKFEVCNKIEGCKEHDNDTGACKCKKGVENNTDGTCMCPSKCVNDCEWDGACKLAEGCDEHDNDTGACICKHGNKDDGSCDDSYCADGTFNPKDGSCNCPTICGGKCLDNGQCIVSGSCVDDSDCGELYYCDNNKCKLIDANNNHMKDKFEGDIENIDCNNKDTCESASKKINKDFLFCDSAMGYKCSVKCNDDAQCVDGFLCRDDGRCVSKYFTTVWDASIRQQSDFSFTIDKAKNIKVCWDWKEGEECDWMEYKDERGKLSYNYVGEGTDAVGDTGPIDNKDVVIKIEIGHDGELSGVNFYKKCIENKGFYNPGNHNEDLLKKCDSGDKANALCEEYCDKALLGNCAIADLFRFEYDLCCDKNIFYSIEPDKCSKLLEMESFGLAKIFEDGNHGVFEQCQLLRKVSTIDIPNPKYLTSMKRMFVGACSFNSPLEQWDVSNVTNMEKTFWMSAGCAIADKQTYTIKGTTYSGAYFGGSKFNQPLNRWDVSKVTSMVNMFGGASKFNQNLNDWDVSNVKDMDGMFGNATEFNKTINDWNVKSVTVMKDMFYRAYAFNQNLSGWKLNKNIDITNMFNYCDGLSKKNYCEMYDAWKDNVNDIAHIGPYENGKAKYTCN